MLVFVCLSISEFTAGWISAELGGRREKKNLLTFGDSTNR